MDGLFGIIGYVLISIGAYLGYVYRHTEFEQTRFDKWRINYLRRFPDAEKEEAEEYSRTQLGAPLGQWLQGKYVKGLAIGKKIALFLGLIGGFLAIVPIIF